MEKVTYWGNKRQVYLIYDKRLAPVTFNYGESKVLSLTKESNLPRCFKIEPINNLKKAKEESVLTIKSKRKHKKIKAGE